MSTNLRHTGDRGISPSLLKWFEVAPRLAHCKLKAYANEDEDSPVVCPPQGLVFRALELTDPDSVKVVILGQDPYHSTGKASGLAFGYHPNYRGPTNSSLANIISEVGNCGFDVSNFDHSLLPWANQGVLLLNTRLTCELEKPMSHAGVIGWEDEVLLLLRHLNAIHQNNIVFLCWGAEAREMVADVLPVDSPNVFATSHPMKSSHMRGSEYAPAFTGSKCFAKVNEYLKSIGREEIAWTSK